MRLTRKVGIIVFTCAAILSAVLWYTHKEPYSTEKVIESLWNKYKYEIQSTQVGEFSDPKEGEPIISIDVYDKSDIPNVEDFLVKNLSKEDLEKYEINVFLFESD